ncbi:hypothetical protein TKK_0009121 [Trichogramma kaykai]|uniref:Rho guanine nucleotide exchange factor 7 n=1 Tax=Trichogramma kaykai TaxID=54128 RepID=A0ABD2X3Z0_9HYME
MSKNDGPKLVVALFTFKGKNNDELCFKKGDIITITQLEDGGWWEGTLNDKTGWFPCNYVQEYKASDSGSSSSKLSPEKNSPESPVYPAFNRDIVLKDIVDSEKANVAELQNLYSHFLHPLETANILQKEEYRQLVGNFPDVLETHQYLLANLENALSQGPEAKVGNIFLTLAPKIKSIHTTYCTYHPQAVCILDRFRDELNDYMERNGAITPGILVLTTGLSKPFRRLDKYSSMLQELERHTEKNHPDRGDTQRSVSVYREIADCCVTIRKQRELALQILIGGIKGWEGEELCAMGDIIHVGPVILISGADRRDRYFVLFHKTLLVLSTSSRMSSFVYEGQLPLTGINIVPLEQSDELRNAFEISGPMIEPITVLCPSRDERQHWMELIAPEQHLTSPSSHANVTAAAANNSSTTTPTTMSSFSRNKSGSASMINRSASGGSFARSTPATSSLTHVSCCRYARPPYTRLSRYFARLVRKRLLQPELLKRLLYLEYLVRPDTQSVRMRRQCLVTYSLEAIAQATTSTPAEPVAVRLPLTSSSSSTPATGSLLSKSTSSCLRPGRKSSSIKLDVVYVLDDAAAEATPAAAAAPSTASMAVYSMEPPHVMPELTHRSLPPRVTESNCCVPNFDSVPYRQLRSGEINLCDNASDDSKNWKSLGKSQQQQLQQTRRAEASLRSSDSGMADSFQYHSGHELGSSYAKFAGIHSESEIDENKFADQCICSSPFGSTPRRCSAATAGTASTSTTSSSTPSSSAADYKSLLLLNDESENENDDEDDDDDDDNDNSSESSGRRRNSSSSSSSGDEDDDSSADGEVDGGKNKCTCRPELRSRFENMTLVQRKHLTQPISEPKVKKYKRPLGHHRTRVKKQETTTHLHVIVAEEEEEEEEEEEDDGDQADPDKRQQQTFTSGLYAHWWLKKPLPIDTDNASTDAATTTAPQERVHKPELKASGGGGGSNGGSGNGQFEPRDTGAPLLVVAGKHD